MIYFEVTDMGADTSSSEKDMHRPSVLRANMSHRSRFLNSFYLSSIRISYNGHERIRMMQQVEVELPIMMILYKPRLVAGSAGDAFDQ